MAKKSCKKTGNSIDFAKDVIERIKENPELLARFAELLTESRRIEEKYPVPDWIFRRKLTLLESVVKYLKENLKFNYKKIAELLKRDQRNIWQVYHSAKKKFPSRFADKKSRFMIPVSVVSDRRFSILEAVAAYLKDKLGYTHHEIALITKRDDRTIWTVYDRYKKKQKKVLNETKR